MIPRKARFIQSDKAMALPFMVMLMILSSSQLVVDGIGGPHFPSHVMINNTGFSTLVASSSVTTSDTSWNPNVVCSSASLVSIQEILGSGYPGQSLSGSQYQVNSSSGGIPAKRALAPPCSISNISGQTVSSFIEMRSVNLANYFYETRDCSTSFDPVNGGGSYPNGETVCDSTGDVSPVGATNGAVHVEIDQDWMVKGYCGLATGNCNNDTIAHVRFPCTISSPCSTSVAIDIQGFVYWDPEGQWEIHPLTAWKLSDGSPPTASFTLSPSDPKVGQQVSFSGSASGGTSPYTYSWNFGDGTTDSGQSVTHSFSTGGGYTVSLDVSDASGLTGSSSQALTVAAGPPSPSNPPTGQGTCSLCQLTSTLGSNVWLVIVGGLFTLMVTVSVLYLRVRSRLREVRTLRRYSRQY